jgi:hypothetical protein
MTLERRTVAAAVAVACALGALAQTLAPSALAVPGPEVEYTYDVIVRRHFDFPNNDAIGYGFGICDKVGRGVGYAQVMGDVKNDVFPNDEQAANYVVSNGVGSRPNLAIAQLGSGLPTPAVITAAAGRWGSGISAANGCPAPRLGIRLHQR